MTKKSKNAVFYTIFKTKLGWFGLACGETRLLKTCLADRDKRKAGHLLLKDLQNPKFDKNLLPHLRKKIIAYYKGESADFSGSVQLDLSEFSEFAKKVLITCRKIKFCRTITYGELAKMAGKPGAGRAVGAVLAKNQLPLIIPCHRVVRADGRLGGFSAAGGVVTKQKMLELEKAGELKRFYCESRQTATVL